MSVVEMNGDLVQSSIDTKTPKEVDLSVIPFDHILYIDDDSTDKGLRIQIYFKNSHKVYTALDDEAAKLSKRYSNWCVDHKKLKKY